MWLAVPVVVAVVVAVHLAVRSGLGPAPADRVGVRRYVIRGSALTVILASGALALAWDDGGPSPFAVAYVGLFVACLVGFLVVIWRSGRRL